MNDFLNAGMHWKTLNFALFLTFLYFVLRKPVAEFWKTRTHKIEFDLEEAARLHREAAVRVIDLEKRIDHLDQESKKIIQTLRDEGESEKKKILNETGGLVEKVRQDADRIMHQEIQRTKEQLKREIVEASLERARQLLQENFNDSDQQKLGQKFLHQLGGQL